MLTDFGNRLWPHPSRAPSGPLRPHLPTSSLRGHTYSGFGLHPPFLAVLVLLWLWLLWLLLVWSFGAAGVLHKRAHFQAPALQTPPKFHEKTPRETQKERKWWRGEGNNAKFWVLHPSAHPSGHHFSWFGGPPFGASFGALEWLFYVFCSSGCSFFSEKEGQQTETPILPKSVWPKSATQILAKVGQFRLAKVGISISTSWVPRHTHGHSPSLPHRSSEKQSLQAARKFI